MIRANPNQRRYLKKRIPENVLPRRQFIKNGAYLLTSIVVLPQALSATSPQVKRRMLEQRRSAKDVRWQTVSVLHDHLLPTDQNSPGAADVNATVHLKRTIYDPEFDPEIRKFILNGIRWLDESSNEQQGADFVDLNPGQREQVLKEISKTGWGESWLSTNLNYIFEALLGHPNYGVNPDGIGWKWLSHDPGFPQPGPNEIFGKMRYRKI